MNNLQWRTSLKINLKKGKNYPIQARLLTLAHNYHSNQWILINISPNWRSEEKYSRMLKMTKRNWEISAGSELGALNDKKESIYIIGLVPQC